MSPQTCALPGIDHGSSRDIRRSRELYKYYQPPSTMLELSSRTVQTYEQGLVASPDPVLMSFALLTANLLSCKRSMISLIDHERIYIIAESTRTLSVTVPHTYAPGDGLWLGGCMSIPREGGLCERTVSLLAPTEVHDDGVMIFEVPDLTKEPVYQNEDYVTGWPDMKFYAGVPLRTRGGFSIGSLCVIDDKPHPGGLKDNAKLTLAKMAETVMGHLERVQAERDMKRGRNMELGISRFLAGNFKNERAEMDDEEFAERVRYEQRSQEKRRMESERLRWIDQMERQQKNNMGTDIVLEGVKTARILSQTTEKVGRKEESDPFARDFASDLNQDKVSGGAWPEGNHLGFPNVKASQLPLSFPTPKSEDFSSILHPGPLNIPELSRSCSYSSVRSGSTTGTRLSGGSTSSISSLSATIPPSSPSDSLFHDSDSAAQCSAATTPTGQLQPQYPDINNSFRSTFARASVLIRKSIEIDGVVFVDADLEDTYDIDDCIDSLKNTPPEPPFEDSAKHRQRPKKCRRRSGVLGYATKGGTSCTNPFDNDSMVRRDSELERSLGFDIGEIEESFLRTMAHRWPHGHIFSCNQSSPREAETGSDDDSEYTPDCEKSTGGKYMKEVEALKRFLPGCTNVVCMPMYDFSGKLFSVGFAWSCSRVRVFSDDVEKSFMAAFGNSIMAEVGRLHCVSADKAKGDFISSVSHELRSPLHGILASAEFLADTDLDNFQRSFVDTIESCGRTLLDTINHVLDFSKLNSFGNKWTGTTSSMKKESIVRRMSRQRGRSASACSESPEGFKSDDNQEPKPSQIAESPSASMNDVVHLTAETDLSAILEEVTEGVFAGYEFRGISTPGIMEDVGTSKVEGNGRPAGAKNDITVIIDVDRRDNGWVFETQPGALRRIFLNLGGNAIKYTDSGWVRIKMRAEDLPSKGDEDKKSLVTLTFTDSGKGISREFLKTRLFTPFSQENPLVSGTGLGMSIVRQIVEMLGGEIGVKSQPGKGTEVTVSLVLKRILKRPDQSLNQETNGQDAFIERIRERTKGKRVSLLGFDSTPPESEAQMRATALLRSSLESYVTKWFGMEIIPNPSSYSTGNKVDFVITNEGAMVNAHLALPEEIGKNMPGKTGGVPLIVICSNAARHDIYQPLNTAENKGIAGFVSKPCGPMKLAKALAFCLDQMEATLKSQAAVSTSTKTDTLVSRSQSNKTIHYTETKVLPKNRISPPPPPKRRSTEVNLSSKSFKCLSTEIPVTVTPSTPVENSSISRWKHEVGRIPSLNLNGENGSKKLPRTLIVEDNPVNLMLLATFLKKKGYPFEKATNGLEAYQAVEKNPEGFDIILMDLQMPVMSGIESTRAIRTLERQRRRKGSLIIALTGLATANDRLEAFEGGIDLFMVKPVSFKHLEKTLQELKLED
ncbi:hypothetical protein DFP73DRAFT_54575 [Morchella snyderi]|nr:hypothetical protein DFP73DRAFT_54575 [Morchella snyderi]